MLNSADLHTRLAKSIKLDKMILHLLYFLGGQKNNITS